MVNFGNIMLGQNESSGWLDLILGLCLFAAIFLVYGLTSWLSLRQPRLVQRALGYVLTRARQLWPERLESRQEYSRRDISPLFRVNGYPPDTDEYSALAAEGFRDWRLRVGGLVERPQELTLGDIRYLSQQSQITRHNCIQGWSAVGEWTGLPLITLLDLCSPLPAARYLIFWSLQRDESGRPFYESLAMRFARQPQTMLAYELNGEALDVPHGAPLRLRVETQLGFKMVKWLDRIEFVDDFRRFRDGMGGSREDLMYYDWTAGI
jgi:DMSO/TMAO reductase YedYZ molybdopterin-dependent catalytic subunit